MKENVGAPIPVDSFQSEPGQPLTNFIPDRIELNCKTTFIEECHNEYKMVCEETTVEREREVCETVQEKICKKGVNTEYEPACFQRIISHCDGVSRAQPLFFIFYIHTKPYYPMLVCRCASAP